MYIKQLIIQGFRSYRDQTIVEPFSPKHNVVVGRNGSGKSNFFYAIQFVLSDEFSHLGTEQRQNLLHEGPGPRVLQAYVEIVFDNSDARVPIDRDEVRLRRTIGAKKDQYYLDGKVATKQEVQNMLETAGLSKSNPYYIVKQGKINELATAPDSYRLQLLREVAGTRVYDERKQESSEILRGSQEKFEKILGLLSHIEERLTTLEHEKKELTEYHECDRKRRGLEHVIFEHELADIRRKLDKLTEKKQLMHSNSNKYHSELQNLTDQIYTLRKEMRELERRWSDYEEERRQLAMDHEELSKEATKFELAIRDLSEEVEGERSSRAAAEEQLRLLKDEIGAKKNRLDVINPSYSQLVNQEQELNTELAICKQRIEELYSKQGWTQRFNSAEERDQWIRKHLVKVNREIGAKTDLINLLKTEMEKEVRRLDDVENSIQESSQEMDQQRDSIDRDKKQQGDMKNRLNQLMDSRQKLWHLETQLTQKIHGAKDELSHTEAALRALISKAIGRGMDSVKKVLEATRTPGLREGYHGLLMDVIDTSPNFYMALESTAGERLFSHVVETADVASQIIKELNQLSLPGSVNFFPLNRMRYKDRPYPDNPHVLPLVNQLTFDEKFRPVVLHCFGQTLICRNIEVASQVAYRERFNCVTLEGDRVSYKGPLTGGYFDKQQSRWNWQVIKRAQLKVISETEAQLSDARAELVGLEGKISSLLSDMQKMETKVGKMADVYEKLKQDRDLRRNERTLLTQSKESKARQLIIHESNLQQLVAQKSRLNADLGSSMMSQLTVDEQRTLQELTERVVEMNNKQTALFAERSSLEAEKNQLESLLQENLMRKFDDLNSRLNEITVDSRLHVLDVQNVSLTNVAHRIADINRKMIDLDTELDKYYKEKKVLFDQLERCQTRVREIQERIEDNAKEMEKTTNKQNMLIRKKEEYLRSIRELGAMPKDMVEKYQPFSLKQLFKHLEDCNNELKRYENVNKKALDQFLSFADQKEKLLKRKEELEHTRQSIVELMDTLDQRKYDAIQFTFKQVSKFFEDVFRELVPAGRGCLVMKTTEVNGENANGTPVHQVDHFTGVGVQVSFSGTDETREMNQLSGGQKSLVALALIFAIQKCDPAPFYLFDEIDAALDANHRKRVGDMIHCLSENAQFITTTFRKELLESAVKFYGVRFRNKVSHIDCVTADEALEFVEDDSTQP